MSEPLAPSPPTTLVVLLGASDWPKAENFYASKAFENSASELERYFYEEFELPRENLLKCFDTDDASSRVLEKIREFLKERAAQLKASGNPARDLIFYFTGHGGFTKNGSDYYLAIRDTSEKNLRGSGIDIRALADEIKEGPGAFLRRIVILDCCFSSAATSYFQSAPEQVIINNANEAFNSPVHADESAELPGRGTSLLCSSNSNDPSKVAPDDQYTMFSEALLHVLRSGFRSSQERMNLEEVEWSVQDYLNRAYPEKAPKPEMHSPDQSEGIVGRVPLFPNPFSKPSGATLREDERFQKRAGVVQCCVIVSETEVKQKQGDPIESVVRKALLDCQDPVGELLRGRTIETEPYRLSAASAFASAEQYRNAVVALCASEIAVFDVTNYEPAVMLLLGIRSVVRRGINISCAGGDYVTGNPLENPFNIKDVNIVPYSEDEPKSSQPFRRISDRIREGFTQLMKSSNYLDLPSFDAIRNLPPETLSQAKEFSDQVLVLCPFSQEYQKNNWNRHIKGSLSVYIKSDPANEKKKEPEVVRTLDLKSPRLVSQSLYEAIRLTDMCLVDWTEWSANVFFELGVRLAASDIGPVCIIEDKHLKLIEDIHRNPEAHQPDPRNPSKAKALARLIDASTQCLRLINLFRPIQYKAPTKAEGGSEDVKAFRKMIAQHITLRRRERVEEGALAPDFAYSIITEEIDPDVEITAKPVYEELFEAANLLNYPELDSLGRSPVLYPSNLTLNQKAESSATERRLAAWYYITRRYSRREITANSELLKIISDLSNRIVSTLMASSSEADQALALHIFRKAESFLNAKE